jgi:AcrR family transcriptional regulator
MAAGPGLRERKKQQTRQLIYGTAARLFAERGFETVTVAEIARAADVSEVTVFNYFPTKEDLFFAGMQFFEERLLEAVRERATGESVFTTFERLVVDGCAGLGTAERADVIGRAATLIGASPALQVREREIVARYTDELARLLAEETGAGPDDVEPLAVAHALMGTQRALVGYVRSGVLAGRRGARLVREARAQATGAFGRLRDGLGHYATKRAEAGQ